MDGNGRWARKKFLNRISGHMKGVDAVREVVTACRELGIKALTLYAFSEENWKRPKEEVTALMGLLKEYLLKEQAEMLKNQIRLCVIGRMEDLPPAVQKTLIETIKKTKQCDGMILNLALSYSGRSEILHAVQDILSDFEKGRIKPEEITQSDSPSISGPGTYRTRTFSSGRAVNVASPTFFSGRLPIPSIYVTDTLWPDFDREELLEAIADYQSRERRFGMTSEQINGPGK